MRNRPYPTEDSIALRDSRVRHQLFSDHLSVFTVFDPTLDAAFAAGWDAANDLAEKHPTDETTVDILQQYTDAVKAAEKNCHRSVNDVRYYAGIAFPDTKSKLREFGLHRLAKVRSNTSQFIIWMKVLHRRVIANQTALTNAGMSAATIAAILTNATALDAAEVEQEDYKLERIALTQSRVAVHTAMWKFVTRIAEAAAIVFEEQPEKKAQFAVPNNSRSSDRQ